MKRALQECVIEGVPTTAPYHKLILDTEDFKRGNIDTGFIPKHEEELGTPPDDQWRVRLETKKSKSVRSHEEKDFVHVMG